MLFYVYLACIKQNRLMKNQYPNAMFITELENIKQNKGMVTIPVSLYDDLKENDRIISEYLEGSAECFVVYHNYDSAKYLVTKNVKQKDILDFKAEHIREQSKEITVLKKRLEIANTKRKPWYKKIF